MRITHLKEKRLSYLINQVFIIYKIFVVKLIYSNYILEENGENQPTLHDIIPLTMDEEDEINRLIEANDIPLFYADDVLQRRGYRIFHVFLIYFNL